MMAKELVIVFVYDCEMCKREEDDPQDAIVYFHPTWVSRDQRHALCSQLMGVTQFFISAFTLPKIVSLQSGKFAIKKLGRYILCVGTDRNIPDIVLEIRSKTLYKLLRLFHYDIESLQTLLSEDDDNSLSDRLAELFQVYLPILHFATNKFGNIPTFKLPKSASNVFLEAVQILKCFQQVSGVLGGVILYQNKVVATQLNYSLTKQLVVCDPYRIKLPAECVSTPFHLPVGVQLLSVYIEQSEVHRLQEENAVLLSALKEVSSWRKKEMEATNVTSKSSGKLLKDASGQICGMKRDVSRIFTVLEESGEGDGETSDVPDVVRDAVKARQLARLSTVSPASFVVAPVPDPDSMVQDHEGLQRKFSHATESIIPATRTIPIRYYSLGLPPIESEWCDDSNSDKATLRPYYNTICDPKYPLFRTNGLPVSEFLFQSRLKGHYHRLKSVENTPKRKKNRPRSIPLKTELTRNSEKLQKAKREFSLPLSSNQDSPYSVARSKGGSGSIPLTPLMAKLSLLAHEQNPFEPETPKVAKTPSVATGPQTTAPKTPLNPAPPPMTENKSNIDERNAKESKRKLRRKSSEIEEDLVPQVLYIFGYSNTALLLLIESSVAVDPDRIHTLWERSLKSLSEFEVRLSGCIVDNHGSGSNACDDYSYVVVDPAWGPIQRGGGYQPHQLELLTTLHHSMIQSTQPLTDIVLRTDDTISYGYQCGESQVYYQQNCPSSGPGGVPTPGDLMAMVALKAKRRLERDHGIVLL